MKTSYRLLGGSRRGAKRQRRDPLARFGEQAIKVRAVRALGALLELRVDVHRHRRVGVTNLGHHELEVELVGDQRNRDVGAAQGVRVVWGSGAMPLAARRSLASRD